MKKRILPIASLLAALVLSSCFQHETTIHLKKDGSGTLVEETRLNGRMFAATTQGSGSKATHQDLLTEPLTYLLSEDKAKKRAAELGEGVTLVKIEPVTVGTWKGARATYRFADINKLRISTDDAVKAMGPPGGLPDAAKPAAKEKKPIAFNYKNGVLTIRPTADMEGDKPNAGNKAEAAVELNNPEGMAMMKQMFTGMKVSIKLVVESGIAETNATHRDGDTITLMEMDMNKLMEKPGNMKKLGSLDQGDPAAAMEALKGIEGVKAELKPEVTVKLNGADGLSLTVTNTRVANQRRYITVEVRVSESVSLTKDATLAVLVDRIKGSGRPDEFGPPQIFLLKGTSHEASQHRSRVEVALPLEKVNVKFMLVDKKKTLYEQSKEI